MSSEAFNEPCDGCGATLKSQRCIGCHHEWPPEWTPIATPSLASGEHVQISPKTEHVGSDVLSAGELASLVEKLRAMAEWLDDGLSHEILSPMPLRLASSQLAAVAAERDALREALKSSGETKAAYIGEFSFPLAYTDDDGNHATSRVDVPWTAIKEIMAAISARAARSTLSPGGSNGQG